MSEFTGEPQDYTRGRKFVVTKEGGRISGLVSLKSCVYGSFTKELPVGTVLTCAGRGYGFGGDPGIIVTWLDENGDRICQYAEFQPGIGHWFDPLPDPSYLRPLDEEETAAAGEGSNAKCA